MTDRPEAGLRLSDALVDSHLDAVLRASGSALRHYSMEKSLTDMRKAMRDAMTGSVRNAFSTEDLV